MPLLYLQAEPSVAETQQLGPVALFELAEAKRATGNNTDAETIYRALTRDPDLEIRSEARFRLGMLLAEEKRYKDAAIVLRALLDEKPDGARVRMELARVLVLLGDSDGARRQLRQARSGALPADVAVVVDQFTNALRTTKRFGGSIDVAIAPDTNINRATNAVTLDTVIAPLTLSRDARERSGLGARLAGQGYARLPIANRMALLGRVSAAASLYGETQFNDVSASLALGPEVTLPRDRIRPTATLTNRYYGGVFYARTIGGAINWTHVVGRRGQIEIDASAARADYSLNDLQSGSIYNASLAVERAFTPRMGGSITVSMDRQIARDPGFANTSGGVTALVWRDVKTATLFGTVTYRHLDADARLLLYTARRYDNFVRIGTGLVLRKLALLALAPVARFAYERNRSSVGIYDYRRLSVELGVTRAF
ncbi:tetratricopeptide repeat protein [Sphingomonas sp. HMP6]|uniref:tetratricopeptide repeat protein n=1 Tax=Sphingomonas sp. HMP6 TaxID=1517551 RepID=UPI001596B0A9|nr:surface lipoprotein assembly modifier [Sphingomonas sp. HMP6]BCA60444.1 hypothetical protein HMP06_3213 [Sphingomonas sp. HMP6]